ncbi:MAG: class I SAM-dependent methyltransferase [Chloroflexota bacterium]
MAAITTAPEVEQRDALVGRLFAASVGAFDLAVIYIGDRLGLYRVLADGGPASAPELAERAGIHGRYAREWLEHQAVGGILDVDDPAGAADERRYSLPAAHAEVLLDPDSLATMAPMARFLVGGIQRMPDLLAAFRSGEGVAWDAYGPDVREAQASFNRPGLLHLLATEWIPAMPDVDERLRSDPPARVADIACGAGWSTIAIARGYPGVRVDGLDLDPASIELAQANLAAAPDVGDRVTFAARDAADPALSGRYDLVLIVEAVHDMSQPVAVLRAARGLLAPGGAALIVDENVAESFTVPGDDLERILYSYSILFCLPNGLADQPSVGTGTVMRPAVLEAMALEAGFSTVTILPIEHDAFRFYRLDP